MTRVSCSWCHTFNDATAERCEHCGHNPTLARRDCDCTRCLVQRIPARPADASAGETWNTCPECFRKWRDFEPTPGLLHRTRLCSVCAKREKGVVR